MEYSIIKQSMFGKDIPFSRLDAEYVAPSAIRLEEALAKHPGTKLSELVDPYLGPKTISPTFASDEALVNYIEIECIDTEDGLTYRNQLLFKDRPSRATYVLREDDILVANVRPNRGSVALINKRNRGSIASSGFTLLRKRANGQLSQEYIFAFLKTSFGRRQLIRRTRGSMYPAVLPSDVMDLWIPIPPATLAQATLDGVMRGLKCHDAFFEKLHDQDRLLEDFLRPYGAPPSPLEGDVSRVNWVEVKSSTFFGEGGPLRFDAEFNRKEYAQFDKTCRRLGPSRLLEEDYIISPGKPVPPGDESVPYIKQGVLTNAGINWSVVGSVPGATPAHPRVRDGDILLACTAHEIYYVGRKVDYVREVPEQFKASNMCVADILVLHPRKSEQKALPGSYIAAFLRSPSGLYQVQRCIRGLRGGHVYKSDIGRYVRVPVPSEKFMKEFETLAESAEQKRNDGKRELLAVFKKVAHWVETLL